MVDDGGEPLSADDAAILALESSHITGHTMKVLVLEPQQRALDIDALRAHILARLPAQPRALQRVEIDRTGGARWVVDPAFDICAHVDRYDGTSVDGDPRLALWAAASTLMEQRLDHGRPLWRLDVVGPFTDGRQAIVARLHHAMVDGISGVRFLASILWTSEPEVRLAPAAAPKPAAQVGGHELRRLPGTLRRELVGRASRTPLAQHIGSARSVAFSFLPLAELHRIGSERPARATVNDVLLAITAAALGGWTPLERLHAARLRAQIPVSLHARDGSQQLGNHDSFLNVDLPMDEPDPLVRVDRVRAETAQRKTLGDADELYDFFHAISRFRPAATIVQRMAFGPSRASVAISNVPGPSVPVTVMGRKVEHLGSTAEPADRHALRISAVSYAGTMAVGLCTDPQVLPDVAMLAESFDRSYTALSAASPRSS